MDEANEELEKGAEFKFIQQIKDGTDEFLNMYAYIVLKYPDDYNV